MSRNKENCPTSGLCRGARMNPEELQKGWGDKSFRPNTASIVSLIALIVISGVLLFLSFSQPTTQNPTVTLSNDQIASFRELYQKVSVLDGEIRRLEVELNSAETKESLSNPANVVKYYQQLSDLQVMRDDRSRYAQNYNGLARIHFTRSKTSPSELATQKAGFLPTGIR